MATAPALRRRRCLRARGGRAQPLELETDKNNTNESARCALTDGGSGGGERHGEKKTEGRGSIERLITVGFRRLKPKEGDQLKD